MKINNQFLRFSGVAFVVSLIPQFIYVLLRLSVLYALEDYMGSYLFVAFIEYFSALIRYAIAPVLIFAVFYFIGKKPDLTLELRSIIVALLIGNIASIIVGSIAYTAAAWEPSVYFFAASTLHFAIMFLAADFLGALAGLSIGYIRQKKLMLTSEPEPS